MRRKYKIINKRLRNKRYKYFKKCFEFIFKILPIIGTVFSIVLAYETVKTSQFSSINALIVEKHKDDLKHLDEFVINLENIGSEIN